MARSIHAHAPDCPCPACRGRRGLVSRPPVFGVRVADDIRGWLQGRPEGAARWIETAVRQAMAREETQLWAEKVRVLAPPPPGRVMKVKLWLHVHNNSRFVRGKSRARAEIEDDVLSRYNMDKTGCRDWEYLLNIPYDTDTELDNLIYNDIYREADRIANDRHCFIEASLCSLDNPERSW